MIYVLIQFSVLLYMGINVNWINFTFPSIFLFGISIFLGIWALLSMGLNNLSVFPKPKDNIKIRINGPYKIIRHPMYTAVILFSLGMLFMNPVWSMYVAVFLLIADLVSKLRYEEKKLQKRFEEYNEYKTTTYCIIPFIY